MKRLIRHALAPPLLLSFLVVSLPGAAQPFGAPTNDQLIQELHDQLSAVDAEHIRARGLLANEASRALADYQQKLIDCGQNRSCADNADREYLRHMREIDKKGVDIDLKWQIQRSRIIAANEIQGLNATGADAECVRSIDSNGEKAALAAADAKHIGDRERIKEQEDTATAKLKKAQIDCSALAAEPQKQCNAKASAVYSEAMKGIQKQIIDVDETWHERRSVINTIIAAKRSVYQGNEGALYQQGIQVGIVECIHQGISPLWSDPSAGVRIGTALATGRIAQLANLAGIAALPGSIKSLKAAICGPPTSSGNEDPYQRGIDDGKAYCKWAAQLSSGAIASARSRIPVLDVDTTINMYRQAINYLKAALPGERAAMFENFAEQMNRASGFTAKRVDLEGGGTLFYGGGADAPALVFDANGNMFRGSFGSRGIGPNVQFQFGPGGTFIPNYSALTPVK